MKFYRQLKKENKKKNYINQKNKHKKDDDGDAILDSGATCHVATRKEYFSSYTPGDFGVVRMVNTGLSRIAGIGDICLKFDTGTELVLHNEKHVLDMRLNIISNWSLDEDLKRYTWKKLKCIRSDNGGEYIGPFDAYCREHGIQHQKTPPKTPQFNGLAERMNRTLVERVRCLLSHAGGKDVSTIIYESLRSKASMHIPKDERSKLDVKNKPCVFLGYGQDELGYRAGVMQKLWKINTRKNGFDAIWQDEMKSLYENNTFGWTKLWDLFELFLVGASLDPLRRRMLSRLLFLHGDLDKEIYMEQPEGFQVKGKEDYQDLSKSFAMKDLGPAKQILGIRIFHDIGAKKLHISQEQYIEKVLRRFNMDKAKVVVPTNPTFKLTDKDCPSFKKNIQKMDRVPYVSAVGSLMYAMVCTMIDIVHAVGVVNRFLSNPEAEYVAATEACKELSFLKRFLQELGFKQQRYAVLCDNQSTIHLAKNSMFYKRTKHIDIRYHWIRDAIEDGMFELNKVHTDDNTFDMLTKAVARENLKIRFSLAGMANSSS
ncbi:retrovirus-related pol polyprotein from transposon TNT 1-94 [Tanacetum coccineum]